MLIGDINTFAVQYEIMGDGPFYMTKSSLWVQNMQLGDEEDTGTLSALSRGLTRLVRMQGDFYEDEFLGKLPEEIIDMITPNFSLSELDERKKVEIERLCKYDRYIFYLGENYDKFMVRVFAINGLYHFLWKLSYTCPESGTKRESPLMHGVVPLDQIKSVVDEFNKRYEVIISQS